MSNAAVKYPLIGMAEMVRICWTSAVARATFAHATRAIVAASGTVTNSRTGPDQPESATGADQPAASAGTDGPVSAAAPNRRAATVCRLVTAAVATPD